MKAQDRTVTWDMFPSFPHSRIAKREPASVTNLSLLISFTRELAISCMVISAKFPSRFCSICLSSIFLISGLLISSSAAIADDPEQGSLNKQERLEWFRDQG